MNSPILQILVLAAIAIFLILRLRNVLGTREGYEKPPAEMPAPEARQRPEVIDADPEAEFSDFVAKGSATSMVLSKMKEAEPSFDLREFLSGARGAYEMILVAYEKGDISQVRAFLSPEVAEAFDAGIAARKERGETADVNVIGVRDVGVEDAFFNPATREGEVAVHFTAELSRQVRNAEGQIIEGADGLPRRERNVWTFARTMGNTDPNWTLVATGG